MKLKIIDIAHHRNGITGAPFDVVLFEDRDPEGSRKVAILFDERATAPSWTWTSWPPATSPSSPIPGAATCTSPTC